jgi:cell division GTPase FtsZ
MRIAAIGVGGAGGRVVDALWRDNENRQTPYLSGACVVDTDADALKQLRSVPTDQRHTFGLTETSGDGTDGDRAAGTSAIEDDELEVRRAIDPILTSDVDAVVLVAGLAGGTGGGATPHIAAAIDEVYDRPLYTVSILPAAVEDNEGTNALRSLKTIESTSDSVVLFDNANWLGAGESIEEDAGTVNESLVERLGALFASGEADSADTVGQSVVDASEITATLSGGGFTTIGYATQLVREESATTNSLLDRLRELVGMDVDDEVDDVSSYKAIESTIRKAARGKLTAECDRESAARGLVVFAGPPEWLHRDAITDGRSWLEDELGSAAIRSGDAPRLDGTHISVLVVLSGVGGISRIEELQQE